MSNSQRSKASLSPRSSGRKQPTLHELEQLEQRTLLSAATLPVGASMLNWGGSQLVVETGSFLLTFDNAVGAQRAELLAREAATRLGVNGMNFKSMGTGRYATFETSDAITLNQAINLASLMPELQGMEPNRMFQINRLPNDERFSEEWWLSNTGQFVGNPPQLGTIGADISAVEAWDTTIGSRSIVVANIDSGIDLTHPDLIPNLWTNPGEIAGNGVDDDGNGYVDDIHGFDFGEGDGNPQDDVLGHGTNTAGVIGAAGNNTIGVTGVNWNVSIMTLKVADQFGNLSLAAIVNAHDYATMMIGRGTNIVVSNNSYGGFGQAFYVDAPTGFNAERDAIERFINAGATFVASAGNSSFDNDNPDNTFFPTSYNIPGLISVAATDNNDALADFSNYGQQTVTLAAPGVSVMTTSVQGGYEFVNGTSFSGPAVAGAVALLQAAWAAGHNGQNASAVAIREALINGCDRLPGLEGKVQSGGRLNIARSMELMNIEGPSVVGVSPGPVISQLDSSTGQPVNKVVVRFSKDIDIGSLSTLSATLFGDGNDNTFGTGDDRTIPITAFTLSSDLRTVTFTLTLTSFAQQRLPIDNYRLTLKGTGANAIKDVNGNFLDGNTTGGADHIYNFRVSATTGDFEPNDTLATATRVAFDGAGQATFTGATVGNGPHINLDVDLYRIDMVTGGLITAEITAKRLPAPSSLDSLLRLFDANGVQIAANDQAFGQDSFLDFFVFTGGTYYIGVSGFGNDNYDPEVVASGSSQSTGVYNIRIQVTPEVDDVLTFTSSADSALPRRIPFASGQTQGTTSAIIDIADTREILDLNIKFDISHTFDSDLKISLVGPDGTTVVLVDRRGSNGQNFTNTILDDEGVTSIANGTAPFAGVFRPEFGLGAYDGRRAAGRWTLVIQDTRNLNSGFLNSWSMTFTFKNDIFGPFESNDTLASAKTINEINGVGTATRTAFIGDGGFGGLDRDIFRFTANAGGTLNVTVTAPGTLNTAIRLFDATGLQVLFNSPAGTGNSTIENYVFANSGVYYLAISESANITYDPTVAASGTAAASTGNYTAVITIAAGVSDPANVLTGSPVSVGVNTGGNFTAQGTGLVFNGIDFLSTTFASTSVLGLVANGFNFSNTSGAGGADLGLPFSLNNASDAFNNRMSTRASFRGLDISRSISYGVNDSFIAIDVYFTNTTNSTISDVGWMEGFNPDPGLALNENNTQTGNDIDGTEHIATATYTNNQFGGGLTIALVAPAADNRARATIVDGNAVIRDPSVLLSQPSNDPNGTVSDSKLIMTYDMGDIAVGGKATIRYFIFFGTTTAAVDSQITTLNAGTGTGHLTADPAHPAVEALQTGSLPAANVPTLPYRVYYPEGFFGDNIYTFVPISNMSDEPASVYVIAHYETGDRDQLVGHINIGANARSGLTITTPELFNNGGVLAGRPNSPYALEVRSDRPVAATFSHYDLGILGGHQAALGESFTSQVSTTWTFGSVVKGNGNLDFLVFFNPGTVLTKVTASYYSVNGGAPIQEVFNLAGNRRGGFAVNDFGSLPDGAYGVVLTSDLPVVASLSHYNFTENNAAGSVGDVGTGATTGVVPEGQFGTNSPEDTISFLNATTTTANLRVTLIFQDGSSIGAPITSVAARSQVSFNLSSIPNFPSNQPFAVEYEVSNGVPLTMNVLSRAFGDAESSGTANNAFTGWGFGEGFRPGDNDTPAHPGVLETLRLYNPTDTAITVEITIGYDGLPGKETFRRTLPARRVTEFNMDQFVTGTRRLTDQWYGTRVKAPVPIVAYMHHYDRAFGGLVADPVAGAAFGTLGTPLGRMTPVS